MKPGRNDPCPCGSGRKFKHCCLLNAETIPADALLWRRVRRAIDPLPRELLREAQRHFGEIGLAEAWHEFQLFESEEPFDEESPYTSLFFAWFLHDWLPDPADTRLSIEVQDATVANAYLTRVGARLDPIARRYVEACCAAPFSFHEVLDVRQGEGFRLRDVMLGAEAEVIERSGSAHLEPGDILFAKLVPVEGIHLVEGMGPVAVPPVHKPALVDLRKRIGTRDSLFGSDVLREFDMELREVYLRIADSLLNPRLPELRNTDGDPLEMHTLIFDLEAPEAAFEALKDLAAGLSAEEVESGAQRNADGGLVRGEITWRRLGNRMHKDWDNTSLGTLRIEGRRLIAEVNSAKRAAALRKLIERRLGDTAHVKPSVVQSVQSMLSREPTSHELSRQKRREAEQADLAAQPEVQQAIREHMRSHYRAWVDQRIPALGNRTPRKAVRDSDGLEAVEALVAQIERDGKHMRPPLDADIVLELRATLGLGAGRRNGPLSGP
ncbi:MAG TPA: SEC-C domain-containing protein [Burkholderiaceae bacterium]|nr:SEC-C domain-containing protein [Burkholderiaceae bacterium]